jgi:DNA-binding protein HU-beta
MRKRDLVRAVADQTNQSEAQAAAAVNAMLAAIQRSLANGDEVTISGFGSFRVVERSSRQGRNPRTGGTMTIGPRRSPAFRAGTQLKRAVERQGADG